MTRMPTKIVSVWKKRWAVVIRWPRPSVAATSSATTSQVQAQPRVIRSVSQIAGRARREDDAAQQGAVLHPQRAPDVDELARHAA